MPAEQTGLVKENYLWKVSSSHKQYTILSSFCNFCLDMIFRDSKLCSHIFYYIRVPSECFIKWGSKLRTIWNWNSIESRMLYQSIYIIKSELDKTRRFGMNVTTLRVLAIFMHENDSFHIFLHIDVSFPIVYIYLLNKIFLSVCCGEGPPKMACSSMLLQEDLIVTSSRSCGDRLLLPCPSCSIKAWMRLSSRKPSQDSGVFNLHLSTTSVFISVISHNGIPMVQ